MPATHYLNASEPEELIAGLLRDREYLKKNGSTDKLRNEGFNSRRFSKPLVVREEPSAE